MTSTHDVAPEVADDRDERAQVQRHVERLVEGVVLLQVLPVAEPRHEDQVARRGDRQQLRRPLDEPQHERLPVRERAGRIPHSEERQHDRDGETAPAEIQRVARLTAASYGRPRARGRDNQNFSQFAEKILAPPLPGSDGPVRFLHAESTERD